MKQIKQLRSMFTDQSADRVVPSSGITARLTLFVSAVMAFLAVFALALSFASGRLAQSWGQDLAGSATVRILAPPGQRATQTEAAIKVLDTTEGVLTSRPLSDGEQRALLSPWIGADLPLDELPIPRLISLQIDPETFDPVGLRLRFAAEVPGAVLDDHGRWRAPLIAAAGRLRLLSISVVILIVAALAAMVTLAANAALAANAKVVAVLRLVGATDQFIEGAFIRRFTIRAATGAAFGTVLGVVFLMVLPTNEGPDVAGLLTALGFRGIEWLVPLILPVLTGSVALVATAAAARKALRDLA
ncbi:MAG: cell division protein FtsX [Paracoccaceae bacterium]